MPFLIFAGNYREAYLYAQENRISDWKFVTSPTQLQGIRSAEAALVGTFWYSKNAHLLKEAADAADIKLVANGQEVNA